MRSPSLDLVRTRKIRMAVEKDRKIEKQESCNHLKKRHTHENCSDESDLFSSDNSARNSNLSHHVSDSENEGARKKAAHKKGHERILHEKFEALEIFENEETRLE